MKSLLWHAPIVLKQMIRLVVLCLAGSVVSIGLILIDFGSTSNRSPSFEARLPPAETRSAAPEIRKLADPLFSPTQRRPEAPSSADDAVSLLRDVRLTGVVIGPDRRIAIFAVSGTNPLVLSEGEALKDWRLDSISPEKVLLSGPDGNITLKPKPDANLVRPPPPVAVQPGQHAPDVPAGAALDGVPRRSMAAMPIAVGNLPAATPVQVQGYPYDFPEYYTGYDHYDPSYSYYAYPYPYFVYGSGLGLAFFAITTFIMLVSIGVPSTAAVAVDIVDAIVGASAGGTFRFR